MKTESLRIVRPTYEGRDLDNWLAMAEQFARRGLLEQAKESLVVARRLFCAEMALAAGCAGESCDSAEVVS